MLLRALLLALLCLAGCAAPRIILTDHPLVGRIWDVAGQRFLSPAEALDRLAAADIALLGEIHDNPVQHHIQAQVLKTLVERGKRPALAMEQFDTDWQSALDKTIAAKGATPADIARAGNLSSGWEWPFYRPLVLVALKQNLPLVAANLSRPRARQIASGGLAALGLEEVEELGLNQPWTASQNGVLRKMLLDGHCGQENPMIDKLVHVQRSKDAVMADKALGNPGGSVLILGRAHARKDIGVPLYLTLRAPEQKVLSVGLLEVEPEEQDPARYADAAPGIHDLVWFTPRNRRPDPCSHNLSPLAGRS